MVRGMSFSGGCRCGPQMVLRYLYTSNSASEATEDAEALFGTRLRLDTEMVPITMVRLSIMITLSITRSITASFPT